ncbi:methanogenesis marker protein Mmp4/MtxX [Methanobrevibacter sp.]|uniref:methanogenesis marker protein Mmp4/MtxX n=1 Tax=Methanobrevibacter sp. TaxID=66852 RepID=UPI00388EBB83
MKTIAIGVGENKNILEACNIFKNQRPDTNIRLIYDDEELVKAVLDEETDGVVRGSLSAINIMHDLKEEYPNLTRATYVNSPNYEFLLTPVGIDEGNTLEDRFEMAIKCGEFLEKLNKTPKIAVLAKGRKGDYGRSEEISTSIEESEKLTEQIQNETEYDVNNYYILVEKAIKDKCNVIIAPDGIIGNIIFRTLVLLDSWPSYGAVTFGIDRIYIDTSRDQTVDGYTRSLILAHDLVHGNK